MKKTVTGAGSVWLTVKPKGAAEKALAKKGHVKVKIEIGFVGGDGSKQTRTRMVHLAAK